MTLTRTPEGFRFQLRIGAGRRPLITLRTQDEAVAHERAVVMAELARLLVQKGRLAESRESIDLLATAESDEEFAGVAEGVRQLCAEPIGQPALAGGGPTFAQVAEWWTDGTLTKRFPDYVHDKDTRADKSIIKRLNETIGKVPLSCFTLEDAEKAMAAIPSELSKATRRHHAQIIRRVLNLSVYPLKIRADSPLPAKGFGPKVSGEPQFVCIYPSEDAALMAKAEVNIWERALYGCAVRWGVRLSNLVDFRWRDFDLVHNMVRCDETKNGKAVEFDIAPGEASALRALKARRPNAKPSDLVFPQLEMTGWSRRLRQALLAAGIDRHVLHTATTTSNPMRFHDLRASFVTFALANGKSEGWIRERTGHTTSLMIVQYERPRVKTLKLSDWLPLDVALGLVSAHDGTADQKAAERCADGAPSSVPTPTATDEAEVTSRPQRQAHEQHTPAERHSPAPAAAAELVQVEHGGGRLGRASAGSLAGSQVRADAAHEVEAALGPGQLEQLEQGGVGHEVGGVSGHEHALHSEGFSHCHPLANGVANGFWGGGSAFFQTPLFYPGFVGTPGGIRTPDQQIRNLPARDLSQHDEAHQTARSTRERTTRLHALHDMPRAPLLLSEDTLRALLALALDAQRWPLVTQLGAQLEALTSNASREVRCDLEKGTG